MKKNHAVIAIAALTFSTVSFAATTETCAKYFKSLDAHIESVGNKAQADALKQQYEQSKKQLSALPEDVQNQTCQQAQTALEASMKAAKAK